MSDGVPARDGATRSVVVSLGELCRDGPIEAHATFRDLATEKPDCNGQGRVHAGPAVAAHRAVVDVDPELDMLQVVRIDTAQDVGKLIHPDSAMGQVVGGIMQGVGLAVMEEIRVKDGRMKNPGFTDYLIPTSTDSPSVEAGFLEEKDAWGRFVRKESPSRQPSAHSGNGGRDPRCHRHAATSGAGQTARHCLNVGRPPAMQQADAERRSSTAPAKHGKA